MSDGNKVLTAFQTFLRKRKGGPGVSNELLSDLLYAFEAGTNFGIAQAFDTMRGGLDAEQLKGLAQETPVAHSKSQQRRLEVQTETPAVSPGHFWRGIADRFTCKNCGQHYDDHIFTDESTKCPTANRESAP